MSALANGRAQRPRRRRESILALVVVLAGFLLYVLRLDAIPMVPRASGEPVRWVETDRRWVAITFDGSPNPSWTPVILRLLKTYGAQATFFPPGVALTRDPEWIRAIVAAGHEVGAAPYLPVRLDGPEGALNREIWAASVRLEAVTGLRALVFRPIAGGNTTRLVHAATLNGERLVLWDIDSHDTSGLSAADVAARVLRGLRRGAIIRFQQGPSAAQALGLVLPRLAALEYRCVTVSELLGEGTAESTPGASGAPPQGR